MSRTATKPAPPAATATEATKPRRNAGVAVDKANVRKDVLRRPRSEPYWAPRLGPGKHVGLRVLESGHVTWIARYYESDTGQKYKTLDDVPVTEGGDGGYYKAVEKAEDWFKAMAGGVKTDEVVTTEDACKRYVAERRASKSEDCAHDAEMRFRRHVYGTKFGRTDLAKIRLAKVKDWRDGLRRKNGEKFAPASVGRTLTALKAALNLAVSERHVSTAVAIEWSDVEPPKGGKRRRDLYLDLTQRRALLGAAKGAVCALIEAAGRTGARPGELVRASVSQWKPHTKEMTFITSKGNDGPRSRTVILPPDAATLFTKLCEGNKKPTARIFLNDLGNPWGHSDWDEPVRDADQAAGLPSEPHTGVCLYTLRHCWITDALMGGAPTLTVARFVGTSVAMIEKHYGHLVAAASDQIARVVML